MNAMLNTALRAARRAGQVINRASLRIERLYIDKKGPKNYVTEVDREAEQIIIDTLKQAYPEHDILAEESGLLRAVAGNGTEQEGDDIGSSSEMQSTAAEYQWVIDPLDGTTNFIHGFPNYAISIGLLHRQQLAHALIFDPVRNELFYASRGEGAFLNDRRVRVSQQRHYHEALLGAHVAGSGGG